MIIDNLLDVLRQKVLGQLEQGAHGLISEAYMVSLASSMYFLLALEEKP